MAKAQNKPNVPPVTKATPQQAAPVAAPLKATTSANFTPKPQQLFMFGTKSFILMLVGLAVIALGFALMSGGKSPDPHKFNYSEIYSFRRITLAPIVVLLGFVIEGIAIMWVPKEAN
jgi:hypothetical protein